MGPLKQPTDYSQCDKTAKCPWVSCRYHLGLDNYKGKHKKLRIVAGGVENMTRTCALEVAEEGEHTLREIAATFQCSNELIRRQYHRAITKLAEALGAFAEEDIDPERLDFASLIRRADVAMADGWEIAGTSGAA